MLALGLHLVWGGKGSENEPFEQWESLLASVLGAFRSSYLGSSSPFQEPPFVGVFTAWAVDGPTLPVLQQRVQGQQISM